jgi:hypothetical protein
MEPGEKSGTNEQVISVITYMCESSEFVEAEKEQLTQEKLKF